MKLGKLYIFIFLSITILSWKFILKEKIRLIFINKTNAKIDSVIFHLNNYKYKMDKIKAKSEKIVVIYPDSIRLNNHDIIIRADIYNKGILFRGAFNYNDLRGDLNKGYILLLNKDSTTSLKNEK